MPEQPPIDFRNQLRRIVRDRLATSEVVTQALILRISDEKTIAEDLRMVASGFGLRYIPVAFDGAIPEDLTKLLPLNQKRMLVMTRPDTLPSEALMSLPGLFAQAGRTVPVFLDILAPTEPEAHAA